jgi:hypothetical protein
MPHVLQNRRCAVLLPHRLTASLVQDSIVDPVLAVYVQIALGDDKVGIAAHGAVRAVAVPHLRERVTN